MINDQPWKPGGSILLRSIEPCRHAHTSLIYHLSFPHWISFSAPVPQVWPWGSLGPLGAPHGRIWPSTSFERPEGPSGDWMILRKSQATLRSWKLPHWPWTIACFSRHYVLELGEICPKPIQFAKNLPHAARLLDFAPRATCYFLQPHSNWMNHNAATSAFQMEKLDRKSGKFQSSICIPSWKYWWINHGITSYWNHDTR